MDEYFERPEETQKTLTDDGWVHTGDIGKTDDDGYVYLLDRTSDMIITGGMNVYSTEVEDVLIEHPAVSQVSVIGVPHDERGEAVKAIVIPAEETPDTQSLEEITDLARDHDITNTNIPDLVSMAVSNDDLLEFSGRHWVMRTGKYQFHQYDHSKT